MASRAMIPNPRYPGAPARLSDGRLFTDYRPNCELLPTLGTGTWADFDRKQNMINTGAIKIKSDRSTTVLRAGSVNCVDTMVPELTKRVYAWNGPVGTLGSHAVGIGNGRLYLPARTDLVAGDPDVLAAATFPESVMGGIFSANPQTYMAAPIVLPQARAVLPPGKNRYSAPYGN